MAHSTQIQHLNEPETELRKPVRWKIFIRRIKWTANPREAVNSPLLLHSHVLGPFSFRNAIQISDTEFSYSDPLSSILRANEAKGWSLKRTAVWLVARKEATCYILPVELVALLCYSSSLRDVPESYSDRRPSYGLLHPDWLEYDWSLCSLVGIWLIAMLIG